MPGSKSGSHAAKKRKIDAKPEEEKPNPFERRKTKLKHNVLGRNVKDTETNVGQLREKAVDIRKKTLLVEYNQRYKKNSFVDRRLGEGDESLTQQEQMAMRWLKERQRHSQGAGRFKLGEEAVLTHRGSALGEEDYSAASDEDSEDLLLGEDAVASLHFGGGGGEEGEEGGGGGGEEGPRKTQKEIYAELIAKSKKAKAERRVAKEEQEADIERLNAELASIQPLLAAEKRGPEPRQARTDDFDVAVRDLARDLRARPTDRLLRPEELAQRARDRLAGLEEERRARQAGTALDEDADGLEPQLDVDLDAGLEAELEPPPPAEPLFDIGEEIPFTLAVPATYTQFAAALRGRSLEDKKLIIHRIRVTNHVHLRPENRLKMGSFYELLLRRFLLLAASPGADAELDLLQVALYRLATEAPEQALAVCKERLASLWAGRAAVWSGPAGPAYLRLLLNLFPPTDFQHSVLTPALTFLGHRLATYPATGPRPLLLSLAYATLLVQALRPTGRYSGELLGFLLAALAHLLGRPTSHPAFLALPPLALRPGPAPLFAFSDLARPDTDPWYAEAGAGALRLTLSLLTEAAVLYRAVPAFPEVFAPLAILALPPAAAALEEEAAGLRAAVAAGLAQHARRLPLRLQHQRPQQIPEYNPRFEEKTMVYKQDRDPDAARVEARRLKKANKDMRKGAGRELRKDAQFLAGQRLQEEKQRRETRDQKLKGIMGFLSNQNQGQGKAKRKR